MIEFLVLLRDVLPCKYCRASYKDFIRGLDPAAFLTSPPAEFGYAPNSRLALARWLFEVHNLVNRKLEKPIPDDFTKKCCSLPWTKGLHEKDAKKVWESALWDVLFTIAWNFHPEPWRQKALLKLFDLLPKVMAGCPMGERLARCLERNPLAPSHMDNLESIKAWLYKIRQACDSRVPSFMKLDEKYESWRSRSCNEKTALNKSLQGKQQKCWCHWRDRLAQT